MNVRIDKGELRRACEALNVSEPQIHISPEDKGDVGGRYHHDGRIYIYCGTERAGGSLPQLVRALNRTFLHELRHHYQNTHNRGVFSDKPGAYWDTSYEMDARDWADQHVNNFKVIRPAPRKVRSTLSKLSAAESRAGR